MASSSFYFVTLLLLASRFSEAALRTYNLTFHSGTKAPDGFSREVYLINGQQPGPLIEVDEGDELLVFVQNDLSVESTIHWHGLLQRGTPEMDGVPGVTQYPIHPGGNFTYKFSVPDQYGFYWYHSHFRTYYDDAIRGALMVHPSPTRPRPFEELAKNSDELKTMLQVERDAASVMLNDWTHELSNKIASRYLETGAFPHCVDSILANGFGRVECLPDYILEAGTDLGLDMPYMGNSGPPAMSSDISSMSMSVLKKRTDTSGPSMSMDMTMAKRTMTHMSPTKSSMQTTSMSPMSSMESMPTSMPSMSSMVSMSGMGMSGMGPMSDTPGTIPLNARGCTPPMMFREGYNISSLPQATCSNTTSPLLTIPADPMRGWIALNLVNSGAVSGLAVSLDAHSMYVYAADGLYVTMQEIKVLYLSIGQRYSVMIKLDQPPGDYFLRYASYPTGDMQQVLEGQAVVSYKMNATMPRRTIEARDDPTSLWMLKNGTATMNSSALDTKLLSPFTGNLPPLGMADTTKIFNISQTGIVTWVMDGDRVYEESAVPVLSGNSSAGWTANTTFRFPSNQTVDIIMSIADDSMDMMGHPIHLHGHKFWVLGSGKGQFKYSSASEAPPSMINLRNPAYRDTADLPMAGWLVIRYVTDNPGAWLFHCHIQWHLESGMALVMVEGEDMLPNIIAASNVTSGYKGPNSNLGASNDARGRDVAYLSVPSLVLCGAMALAAFF